MIKKGFHLQVTITASSFITTNPVQNLIVWSRTSSINNQTRHIAFFSSASSFFLFLLVKKRKKIGFALRMFFFLTRIPSNPNFFFVKRSLLRYLIAFLPNKMLLFCCFAAATVAVKKSNVSSFCFLTFFLPTFLNEKKNTHLYIYLIFSSIFFGYTTINPLSVPSISKQKLST